VGPGTAVTIRPGTVHRFDAPLGRVTLLEASTAELKDVVRIADDYGRAKK
jgi:D-lyxose ketol-isomerase